jgi:hypothetical protein
MQHKYQTQMRLTKLLQTIHNLSIYWNKFQPGILLSCMRHFAMFLFFAILFSYTGKQKPEKSGFYSDFSGAIILRTIVVEYVKSRWFWEHFRITFTGQWLSIPFIRTVFFYIHSWKPVKFRSCLKVISKSDIKKASEQGFSILSL